MNPPSPAAPLPTLVTAVFDLGRDRLSPPFYRDSGHYSRYLPAVMAIDLPMVIYTDSRHLDEVRSLRASRPTVIHQLDPEKLAAHALYEPVQKIRQDPQWLARAHWLGLSPQGALPGYNPVVMSKPIWLYEQAQRNPFNSSHFYWIDAGINHTVPAEWLHASALAHLPEKHQRFLLLCFPQEPVCEVHGFEAAALARLSGVERTRWVARGGLFGGPAGSINEVVARYSHHLEQTLSQGLMGTEESILTLQSYIEAEMFDLYFIGSDGLYWPFFWELASKWPGNMIAARTLQAELCETWFVSYNTPLQFECLLNSIKAADPALLRTARRVLVNNSTDAATFAHYDELCARHDIEQIREGNRGINGARIHAARLFHRSGRHAMYWFEDDMLLVCGGKQPAVCENGLTRHLPEAGATCLAVLQREFADYVKFSFTEAPGTRPAQAESANPNGGAGNHDASDAIGAPWAALHAFRSINRSPYAVGDTRYSNWPQVINRRGTQKLFFEEPREPCLEQYWKARSGELLRLGQIKAAALLASPVNHHRTENYAQSERVEYQRLEGDPEPVPTEIAAPLNANPAARTATRRDWPLEPGTLFVSVANYRDSETPHTLRSLLANATHPGRIRIGVFSQVVPGEDEDCLPRDVPPEQLRELRCHAKDSLGACWARSRIFEELLQGEEFVLQIDSHMRFEPGWDDTLIDMLARCPTPRALITTYPPAYVPPAERGNPFVTILAADCFNDWGILLVGPHTPHQEPPPVAPLSSAFLSANLLFGPAIAFREVPYDPHLYFHGEEISMAARFWTHGWDLYAPDRCVAYHDYSTNRGRHRHWDDQRDWGHLNMRSFDRLRHLFGIEKSHDPATVLEIDRYSLGTARTLSDYEEFADIDFGTSRIGTRAADARFPISKDAATLARKREARLRFIGSQKIQNTPLSVVETRCGLTSTLAATAQLRPALAGWLREQDIRRLVDAGCGDFNWMSAVDLSGLELYAGYDLVSEIIVRNQQLYGERRGHFFTVADITGSPLAACDAILCRHVFEQIPPDAHRQTLERFRASGARWLLSSLPVTITDMNPTLILPDVEQGLFVYQLRQDQAA